MRRLGLSCSAGEENRHPAPKGEARLPGAPGVIPEWRPPDEQAARGRDRNREEEAAWDRFGYAMAYRHADGYQTVEACQLVACADISEENGRAFAETYGIERVNRLPRDAGAQLDMVSICTWMHLHESMVLDAIAAGVKAIHCEKPMADTWGRETDGAAARARRAAHLQSPAPLRRAVFPGEEAD